MVCCNLRDYLDVGLYIQFVATWGQLLVTTLISAARSRRISCISRGRPPITLGSSGFSHLIYPSPSSQFLPNPSIRAAQLLNGSTCCPKTACLQSGHSGFSSTQSNIHVQQNTCPHVVTLGSFIGSRQSVHFRVCFGCSHASVEGSESS